MGFAISRACAGRSAPLSFNQRAALAGDVILAVALIALSILTFVNLSPLPFLQEVKWAKWAMLGGGLGLLAIDRIMYRPPSAVRQESATSVVRAEKTPNVYEATVGYTFNGSPTRYSNQTSAVIGLLKKMLSQRDLRMGEAVDNGDCFFHAFAQLLRQSLGIGVTIGQLRGIVKEKIDKKQDENVVYAWFQAEERLPEMQDYISNMHKDWAKCEGGSPEFGGEDRDGVILCKHFGVSLKVYRAQFDDSDRRNIPTTIDLPEPHPITGSKDPNARTLLMAYYGNHYVPVFRINTISEK